MSFKGAIGGYEIPVGLLLQLHFSATIALGGSRFIISINEINVC